MSIKTASNGLKLYECQYCKGQKQVFLSKPSLISHLRMAHNIIRRHYNAKPLQTMQ